MGIIYNFGLISMELPSSIYTIKTFLFNSHKHQRKCISLNILLNLQITAITVIIDKPLFDMLHPMLQQLQLCHDLQELLQTGPHQETATVIYYVTYNWKLVYLLSCSQF